jgi:hypothetical protein
MSKFKKSAFIATQKLSRKMVKKAASNYINVILAASNF